MRSPEAPILAAVEVKKIMAASTMHYVESRIVSALRLLGGMHGIYYAECLSCARLDLLAAIRGGCYMHCAFNAKETRLQKRPVAFETPTTHALDCHWCG